MSQDNNPPPSNPDPNQPPQISPDDAFGFPEQKIEEKYDTRYLVTHMARSENSKKLAAALIVLALGISAGFWLYMQPNTSNPEANPNPAAAIKGIPKPPASK